MPKTLDEIESSLLIITDCNNQLRDVAKTTYKGDALIIQVAKAMAGTTKDYTNYHGRARTFLEAHGALTSGDTLKRLAQALNRKDLADKICRASDGVGDRYISLAGHGEEIVRFSMKLMKQFRSTRERLGAIGILCTLNIFGPSVATLCGQPQLAKDLEGALICNTDAMVRLSNHAIMLGGILRDTETLDGFLREEIDEKRLGPVSRLRYKIVALEKAHPLPDVRSRAGRLDIGMTGYHAIMSMTYDKLPHPDVINRMSVVVDMLLGDTSSVHDAKGKATPPRVHEQPALTESPLSAPVAPARMERAPTTTDGVITNLRDGALAILIDMGRQLKRAQDAQASSPITSSQRFKLAELVITLIEVGQLDQAMLQAALEGNDFTGFSSSPVMGIIEGLSKKGSKKS